MTIAATIRSVLQPSAILLLSALPLAAQQTAPVVLDRIAAVVNGDPIFESDIQQEMRMAAFEPGFSNSPDVARNRAIERLIDRALITAQEQWQPPVPVTDDELAADIAEMQRRMPDCVQSKCASQADWLAVLNAHGFTEDEFNARWRARMEMLRFIEQRFRTGIHITPSEIQIYYNTVLTPQYAAVHADAPPLSTISTRIEQLLLEQRISTLLDDWLTQLRAQGNVHILAPGEELP
jgi:hypothetical protein